MKKKIIIIVVSLGLLSIIGFLGFKWYLNSHKAGSEVVPSDTETNGVVDSTTSGVELDSFDHLMGTYSSTKEDPPTSEVTFETYGTTATTGIFRNVNVEASFIESMQVSLKVKIESSSIFSNESTRDEHLKGDGFFNVSKFTDIIFESTEIIKGDTSYVAKGNISMLGTSKVIEVPFIYKGSALGKENVEVFEGKFEINPTKHGLGDDAGEKVTIGFYTELKLNNN
ncbi:MAG: polyisoprenoid-binding protein YceI [Parvicella sp.]|jgi:polyisoprenoid-binding protein YceI